MFIICRNIVKTASSGFISTSLDLDIVRQGHCTLSNPGIKHRPYMITTYNELTR